MLMKSSLASIQVNAFLKVVDVMVSKSAASQRMKCIVVKIICLDAMLTQVTVLMHLEEMLIGIFTSVWTRCRYATAVWIVWTKVMKMLSIVSIHCYCCCHFVFTIVHDNLALNFKG